MIGLVTGGARAGKSRYVLGRAEAEAGPLAFVATATPGDEEMRTRIVRHQAERGPRWRTFEAPLALPEALHEAAAHAPTVVVDCLTLWVSNLLFHHEDDAAVEAAIRALPASLPDATIWFVTNEVGLGIVPENALARRYRDLLGRCNQVVAAAADEVLFLVAGLPMRVK